MYRVGFPGWKFAARMGVPMTVRVDVKYDPEVKSYWTTSPDMKGLVVTGESLDEVRRELRSALSALMAEHLGVMETTPPQPLLRLDPAACAA